MLGGQLTFFVGEARKSLALHRAANAISVACIALSLMSLAFLVMVWANAESLLEAARAEAEIIVYLSSDASEEVAAQVLDSLRADPAVASARVVTADEALTRVESVLGSGFDILDILEGYNPFTLSIEIGLDPEYGREVADLARGLAGVELVRDNEEILQPLASLTRVARWLGLVVALGVAMITLALLSHIVRLSMSARRDEMETLRFLGASEWFVSLPFMIEGALLGGLGALLCLAVTLAAGPAAYGQLQSALPFLPWVDWSRLAGLVAVTVLPLGVVAGTLGAVVSLRTR